MSFPANHIENPTEAHEHPDHECELSTKYTDFISHHLESLKSKCQEFSTCISEVLTGESAFAVISGDDISLKTICGMIQTDQSNSYNTKLDECSISERDDIRRVIEAQIKDVIQEESSWSKVKKCLQNNFGDKERSTYVNDICRLANRQELLCRKRDIHEQAETFFNAKMHQIKCTCDKLNEDSGSNIPLGAIIGGVVAFLIVLVLSILLAVFCYKYRKAKKKKSSPSVIYLPAPHSETYPVYQEVPDNQYDPRYRPSPPSNLPPLPNNDNEDNPYLEPGLPRAYRGRALPPVVNTVYNPSYDDPPAYREREEAEATAEVSPTNDEDGYFDPLPSPTEENYDSLLNEPESPSTQRRYEPFNSFKSGKLGPDPSNRTKKEDRETESTYFELEKVSEEDYLQTQDCLQTPV